ncbi:hypothetical protein POTOM_009795 [Populus tomentosa]|uniref:O-methyltransferase C-terminal domain-containing protein n=1 Tax=Populus tomentosa TaxID=118781 RepID=A0A8X8ABQ0_POPTO|nr:hypothetical protein POTOM_009795 [Populus tomentosa]
MLSLLASYSEGPTCKFLVKLKVEVVDLSPLCFSLHHYEVFMKSWYLLNDAILGRGLTAYEYPETDQMFSRVHGFKELVDVGGGSRVPFNIISSKHPHIQGTNYDLPHVIADAPSYPGDGKVIIVELLIGAMSVARNFSRTAGKLFQEMVICCAYNNWAMEFQKAEP